MFFIFSYMFFIFSYMFLKTPPKHFGKFHHTQLVTMGI